jgi:hypothetical protein
MFPSHKKKILDLTRAVIFAKIEVRRFPKGLRRSCSAAFRRGLQVVNGHRNSSWFNLPIFTFFESAKQRNNLGFVKLPTAVLI